MNVTARSTCEIIFVSVVILNRGSDKNVVESVIDQVKYHHKSIDALYSQVESCKVVISDQFTQPLLQEVGTSFQYFEVESAGIFSSILEHPWSGSVDISKTALINGCPLPRMQYVAQFLSSLEHLPGNIVFIDTDTLILGDLREVFVKYPDLDIGFTMGGHYVKKQDPNHFINVGVIFIGKSGIPGASKLLKFISQYCINMNRELSDKVILDQYSTFEVLERYKVDTLKGTLMGRRIVGDCVAVDVSSGQVRVYFLSEEFNTVGKKLYKTSRVAHFVGDPREKMRMVRMGKALLGEGLEIFMKRYAHRVLKQSRSLSEFPRKCKN